MTAPTSGPFVSGEPSRFVSCCCGCPDDAHDLPGVGCAFCHPRECSAHFCGCCGEQIGAGTRSDPLWCSRCKPHIKGYTDAPAWDRTYFAQHKTACPYQVGTDHEETP